jgi:toxin secretion/phage lysis holin
MKLKMTILCSAIGTIGALIARALGGWDNAVITLVVLMIIDFVMGLLCALVFGKSNKSENGALSSKACWQGITKKVCTGLIVVVAHRIDVLVGSDYIRTAVIIAFCVSEIISISETAGLMGILPEGVQKVLMKAIDILKNKGDKK